MKSYRLSSSRIGKKASKKLILVGQMVKNPALQSQLEVLALDPSVVILVENTSNLVNREFIHCVDRTIEGLNESDIQFCPEILLTFGGAIVSKKIKALFQNWPITQHWNVGFDFPEMDTYRKLSTHVSISPVKFCKNLNQSRRNEMDDFSRVWKQRNYSHFDIANVFLSDLPYCDLSAFQLILDCIPDNSQIHLGNSSVIRYTQLFDPVQSMTYHSNRGTSGIDGSLAQLLVHHWPIKIKCMCRF